MRPTGDEGDIVYEDEDVDVVGHGVMSQHNATVVEDGDPDVAGHGVMTQHNETVVHDDEDDQDDDDVAGHGIVFVPGAGGPPPG